LSASSRPINSCGVVVVVVVAIAVVVVVVVWQLEGDEQ